MNGREAMGRLAQRVKASMGRYRLVWLVILAGLILLLLPIPVIASGDLFMAEDGVRCLAETGVDTVMYARGALRDPAIFKAHLDLLAGREPEVADVSTLLARIREHARLARELSTEKVALLKMRTIVPRYVRHIEGSKQLRADIIACRSWDDFEKALRSFEAGKSSSE